VVHVAIGLQGCWDVSTAIESDFRGDQNFMRKIIVSLGLLALSTFTAFAQDVPRTEVFLGYTFTRANSDSNIPAFSMNGGSGQFVYNFNSWLGAVADFGAVVNQQVGIYHGDTTLSNYLFGPRYTVRKWSHVTPYFHMLFGGVYGATSAEIRAFPITVPTPYIFIPGRGNVNLRDNEAISARLTSNSTTFAYTLGGGLDVKVSKHVSIRPIQLEWYKTNLQNLRFADDNSQNNLRYSAGVNFTFGAQ
jgi:opacity protein-like surface antigen